MLKLFIWPLLLSSFLSHPAYARVPEEAYTFDFNVDMIRMAPHKEDKLYEAIELVRRAFSSYEFKERILNHTYRGKRAFANNQGLSNLQIYHRILAGVEKRYPWENNAMDLEVQLYTDLSSNVLGYTLPFSKRIWMNTKYFNRNSVAKVAGNLVHEWLHKLGFGHSWQRTPDRKYSVPYAVGYIIQDLATEMDEWDYYDKDEDCLDPIRSLTIRKCAMDRMER